jgi:putative peptidoglycan lipid II flippase
MFLFLMGLLVGFELMAPKIIRLLAPGFTVTPERFKWTVDLARLMFPYIVFVALANILGGVLNSYGRFAAAAAMQMFFNFFMIASLLLFSALLPTPGHALAIGVLLAGASHLGVLWYASRDIFAFSFERPRLDKNFSFFLKGFCAAALGAGVTHFITLFNSFFASFLQPGSLSCLFYADRLVQLPLGVIGVALGTALLPALSHAVQHTLPEEVASLQVRAFTFGLLLAIPAAFGLFFLAEPIIQLLFKRGAFNENDVFITACCLKGYAIGLPAYILSKIGSTCFFAHHDPRSPAWSSVCFVAVHISVAYFACQRWGALGIALALSTGSWVNAVVLWALLKRGKLLRWDQKLSFNALKIVLSSALMIVVLKGALPSLWCQPTLARLLLAVTGGGGVFLVGVVLQNVVPRQALISPWKKSVSRWKRLRWR